jgi:hypothetical protein
MTRRPTGTRGRLPVLNYDTSNLSPFTGAALCNQLVSGWLLCVAQFCWPEEQKN